MITIHLPQTGFLSTAIRRLAIKFLTLRTLTLKLAVRFLAIPLMAIPVLAGCGLPGAGVGVEGDLKLLYAPFSLTNPPKYWFYAKRPDHLGNKADIKANTLYWDDIGGHIALAMRPAIEPFELGRRTNIAILASPYLSFDWYKNASATPGDIELILGFRAQSEGNWGESDLGAGKPPMDHIIRLPIGVDADGVTGWQRDYFDLSSLHRRYWPDTDEINVRLVWIGIATTQEHRPDVAGVTYLSHILLSR